MTTTQGQYSPQMLLEQFDAYLIDSVSKNLQVKYEVAQQPSSKHIPIHLLFKSHVCKKFDATNISTLASIESKTGLREKNSKRDPSLKSFLRQKESIVADVVIPALLKLVAREASSRSSLPSDEFSLTLEEDGVYKSYSLYKERKFAKLGFTAGALFDCLPQFQKLLETTSKNNLLVRACRLYLEIDFVMAVLKALSNFTYHVTMPFLNYVERVDQNALFSMIPNLFHVLRNGNLICDDLKPLLIKWTNVTMEKQELKTALDKYLIKLLCQSAASELELQ